MEERQNLSLQRIYLGKGGYCEKNPGFERQSGLLQPLRLLSLSDKPFGHNYHSCQKPLQLEDGQSDQCKHNYH